MDVPFDLHRYIIGQKGSGIRKMMEDYEVRLGWPPPPCLDECNVASPNCFPCSLETFCAQFRQTNPLAGIHNLGVYQRAKAVGSIGCCCLYQTIPELSCPCFNLWIPHTELILCIAGLFLATAAGIGTKGQQEECEYMPKGWVCLGQ